MTQMDTPRILTVTIEVNVPGHIEAYKPDQIGAAALEFARSLRRFGADPDSSKVSVSYVYDRWAHAYPDPQASHPTG
ncbi:MAG: hypothetical protein ACLPN6_15350 [Streptosporangiaceae bacterium]|jgi:hypothetical protein